MDNTRLFQSLTAVAGTVWIESYLFISKPHLIIAQENVNLYNMIFTIHGIIMIFFNIMPGLFGGFGNYFLPILCGSPELSYPRINSISLLLQPIAFILIILSTAAEFGGGTGWTLYPPLSTSLMSLSPVAVDVIILGLLVSGIASIMSSLNFITTIMHLRSKGLTLGILSVSTWSLLITSIMLLLTLPILTGGVLMLLSDLHFNTLFFDPTFAVDPILYQHLFWFFGHPEVYILILPAFGVISHVISTNYCRSLFGNQSMILAMSCIAILGSVVCVISSYVYYLLEDFSEVSSLLALLFICTFTFGGTTGVILGNAAINIALHDTYYVIAHFHFVLSIGAIIGLFTTISHFQENFFGKCLRENSIIVLWSILFFIGVIFIFLPMHFLGFNVMPRRIPDYPDALNGWNMICSIGSTMTLFGIIFFIQILTGVFLASRYTPDISYAYYSIQHILRELWSGWCVRYMHATGASLVFFLTYLHILRGLNYSYLYLPLSWISGLIIFALFIVTAFIGYVLPWGQMSYWGATVITNLLSSIPALVIWLCGGYTVSDPTIKRFFVLHFILPFVALCIVFIHIFFLHLHGSTNPLGYDTALKIPFYPNLLSLDVKGFNNIIIIFLLQSLFGIIPLSHPDNAIIVNTYVTPIQIVPEW
ncbi:uncharacterized protein MKS88_000353, partial [Plasmodium brasilianum]|uniref:uncharacterized protein n=1 Tax=Plasmodium brasilianum TaxID=5824 RepID=UPI00350E4B80